MAAKKKANARKKFVIFRVTSQEKNLLEEAAMELNMDFSVYMRKLLGMKEDNG